MSSRVDRHIDKIALALEEGYAQRMDGNIRRHRCGAAGRG
jgi:hypothetical protein